MSVNGVCVAFQMSGDDADRTVDPRHNGGDGIAAPDAWLIRIARPGFCRKPMAVIVQPDQGGAFKRNRRQDCISVPAQCVEVIRTETALGRPTQVKLVKFDAKGVSHSKGIGHSFGCVSLCSSGHSVINFGQQNDIWGDFPEMRSRLFREKAPFYIPGGHGEFTGEVCGLRFASDLNGIHRFYIGQNPAMRVGGAWGRQDCAPLVFGYSRKGR
ncbi:hypothetical protein RUESEDTHA_04006 [Ruegeria sp. THAF57]|nr:hypothetical protein RUESEDTHA_04006 [Ruegeria sp. THAF57]